MLRFRLRDDLEEINALVFERQSGQLTSEDWDAWDRGNSVKFIDDSVCQLYDPLLHRCQRRPRRYRSAGLLVSRRVCPTWFRRVSQLSLDDVLPTWTNDRQAQQITSCPVRSWSDRMMFCVYGQVALHTFPSQLQDFPVRSIYLFSCWWNWLFFFDSAMSFVWSLLRLNSYVNGQSTFHPSTTSESSVLNVILLCPPW